MRPGTWSRSRNPRGVARAPCFLGRSATPRGVTQARTGCHVSLMRYKAKIDWWIGAAIITGMVVPFAIAITSHSSWHYGVGVVVWVIVFGFCYPQSYETTAVALIIRAGFSKWTIPYSQISAVRPSSDSRSALALSLDRVEIEYASGDLLIAPEDQAAFFADLASRASQLSRRGQDLVIALS